mmetsp:Transcript_9953/g.27861  ORF Transcript_9953/g.27861 Transcript_9953/m.27861 type:complete len:87 (+) Transcript_9953:771-1031(+)
MFPVDESRACIALFVATNNVVSSSLRTGGTEPRTFTFVFHVEAKSNGLSTQPCTLRDKVAKNSRSAISDNAGAVDVAQFTFCKVTI